ncbi:MAG: hypothetical protein Q9181_006110 [Wetmoreana brouardii]
MEARQIAQGILRDTCCEDGTKALVCAVCDTTQKQGQISTQRIILFGNQDWTKPIWLEKAVRPSLFRIMDKLGSRIEGWDDIVEFLPEDVKPTGRMPLQFTPFRIDEGPG